MNTRNTVNTIFGTIGSAIRAAAAVEGNRTPRARDLKALGIDPVQFGKIGR